MCSLSVRLLRGRHGALTQLNHQNSGRADQQPARHLKADPRISLNLPVTERHARADQQPERAKKRASGSPSCQPARPYCSFLLVHWNILNRRPAFNTNIIRRGFYMPLHHRQIHTIFAAAGRAGAGRCAADDCTIAALHQAGLPLAKDLEANRLIVCPARDFAGLLWWHSETHNSSAFWRSERR